FDQALFLPGGWCGSGERGCSSVPGPDKASQEKECRDKDYGDKKDDKNFSFKERIESERQSNQD
ncbi:MAG TPA: hypothetical protein VNA16_04790, partial [Abditibacteriaceae bacterium]|nr:hypothetical protein [Abditibacteriaceae bacterium]